MYAMDSLSIFGWVMVSGAVLMVVAMVIIAAPMMVEDITEMLSCQPVTVVDPNLERLHNALIAARSSYEAQRNSSQQRSLLALVETEAISRGVERSWLDTVVAPVRRCSGRGLSPVQCEDGERDALVSEGRTAGRGRGPASNDSVPNPGERAGKPGDSGMGDAYTKRLKALRAAGDRAMSHIAATQAFLDKVPHSNLSVTKVDDVVASTHNTYIAAIGKAKCTKISAMA